MMLQSIRDFTNGQIEETGSNSKADIVKKSRPPYI